VADLAGDRIAGAQVEAANLAGRDIDVIRACQIRAVGRAQEAKTVRQNFQHAIAGNILAVLGVRLEDGENDVLFAGSGDAVRRVSTQGAIQKSDQLRFGYSPDFGGFDVAVAEQH
jgi:hypothetical protein